MDALINPAFVKALADAGVAIAALFVIIVIVWLVFIIVRYGFKLMARLLDALDRVAASEERQNSELASMRADIQHNGHAISDLESRFDKLPAEIRNELAGSFNQLLDAFEKASRRRRWL